MAKKNKLKNQPPPQVASEEKSYTLNLGQLISRNGLYLTILGVLVLAVYANSLGNGFVSDDKGISQEGFKFFTAEYIFKDPLNFLGRFFQGIEYLISGTSPIFYRLVNLSAHLGNTFLVFVILAILARPRVAFFTAGLFAVHPVLTEAVTWISGGNYAHATFFFLLSFLFYILSKGKKPYFYWLSVGVFVFGMLYTNRIMTHFPILILYELVFGNFKKSWQKLIPYVVLSVIWGAFYVLNVGHRVGEVTKTGNVESFTYNPLFYLPFSISWYFELLFFPNRLSFYHSDINASTPEMVLRWGTLLLYVGSLVISFLKKKFIFFWLAFFFLGLLLFLTPFQIAWLVADRYLYLSSIGIFAAASYLLGAMGKNKNLKILSYVIFGLIVALLGTRTIVRNIDWQNEDTLMVATLRTNPENAKVHNHIGTIYGRKGDYVSAMKEFEIALKLDPQLAETYHNIGNSFDEQARNIIKNNEGSLSAQLKKQVDDYFKTAIPLYEKALSLDPNHWLSYQQLANIYFDRGDYQKTADYIIKMLPLNPNPQLLDNLGFVYLQMGDKVKARQAFSEALKANPQDSTAAQAIQQIDNPTSSPNAPPGQTPTDSALPGGQLPPEVLKAIQEQTQKGTASSP